MKMLRPQISKTKQNPNPNKKSSSYEGKAGMLNFRSGYLAVNHHEKLY